MEKILFYIPPLKENTAEPAPASGNGQTLTGSAVQKYETVNRIATDLSISCRRVLLYETEQQTGYLAGLEGFQEKKLSVLSMPPVLPEEMLVICGLSEEKLDLFLQTLRSSGAGVSLKAVLTPHNAKWSFSDLYNELRQERKALSGK